ncbi:MAG: hypothetical protein Q8P75_01370 [bacterium]|nr:hypothetical protein [bacterium]
MRRFLLKFWVTITLLVSYFTAACILRYLIFQDGQWGELGLLLLVALLAGTVIDLIRWHRRYVRRFISSLPPRKSLRPL